MDCVFKNFNTFSLRHNCCKPCFLDYRLWSSGSWNLAEDSLWGLRFIVTPICPFKCRLVGHSGRHYYLHSVISRVLWLLVPEQVHVSHSKSPESSIPQDLIRSQYFSLVVFMFIAEFLVGSLAFVFRVSLGHTFRQELQNGLWHHYNVTARGPNSLVTIWDNLQSEVFHPDALLARATNKVIFHFSSNVAASSVTKTGLWLMLGLTRLGFLTLVAFLRI
jgi:hypothetical protein